MSYLPDSYKVRSGPGVSVVQVSGKVDARAYPESGGRPETLHSSRGIKIG
jgi:hypothetical protein